MNYKFENGNNFIFKAVCHDFYLTEFSCKFISMRGEILSWKLVKLNVRHIIDVCLLLNAYD